MPNPPIDPPLDVPTTIQFNQVDPQTFAQADGGGKFDFRKFAGASVLIDGDTNGVFSVRSLETLHLVRDPELPKSPPTWQTLTTIDGAGPIDTKGARALDITVAFACPPKPQQTLFDATAVVVAQGTTSPALMRIPIHATVNPFGRIRIVVTATTGIADGILPGQTATLNLLLESTMDHDVSGTISCNSAPFSSPAVSANVPAHGEARLALPVTCAPGTAAGQFDQVACEFQTPDAHGHTLVNLSFKVLFPRTVSVTTNLANNLSLEVGSSTVCKVTSNDSGGLSAIQVTAGAVPKGVNIVVGDVRLVGGSELPNQDKVEEVDVTISVAPGTPAGTPSFPLVLTWLVPADGSHPHVSGDITFNCNVVAPGSLEAAARQAITAKYQQLGGFKGPLGLILSDVNAIAPRLFSQSFSGGDIRVENGQVSLSPILETTITYEGAHCFGNPKLLGSDSVYLIVSIYPPSNPERAVVFKIPDDGGSHLIDDFEQGQDNNEGIRVIFGGAGQPPVPLVITTMVMGSSLLGDSQKVKDKVKQAIAQAADQAGAAEGQLASPGVLDFFAGLASSLLGGLLDDLGLTDQVRGKPQSIQLQLTPNANDFVPNKPQQLQGPITFNFETPLLTDGDASYKAFFNVQTVQLTNP